MILQQMTAGLSNRYRVRWRFSQGMVVLGLLALVLSFTLLPRSSLPDFMRGFYAGGGAGLTIVGVFSLLKLRALRKDPEKLRAFEIRTTDEREIELSRMAAQRTFWGMYFVLAAALFISLPFSVTVCVTIFAVFWVMFLLYFVSAALLRRKM